MTQADGQQEAFEGWAILELMGHRRLAGMLTEREIAGHRFLRLDVHDGTDQVVTQFYSPSSVYAITPSTEQICRALGARLRPAPVSRYEIEPPRPGTGPASAAPGVVDPGGEDLDDEDPWH